MKAHHISIFGLAYTAALTFGACGKNNTGTTGGQADAVFVDGAPTVEAVAPDTGASTSAARDESARFDLAPVTQDPIPLVTTPDDLQFQIAANGHQDGPITVSVTQRVVAADLVGQVKPIFAIIEQMTASGAANVTLTKSANSHVWVFNDNGIDYQFTEKKGGAGFGWNLQVKKEADTAYVEVMLGHLKRDAQLNVRAHGEGYFGIDFDKYNSVVGGTATGQAFAAFRHNKVGAYHLFALNNFSIDGTTMLSTGLSYIHVIRLFANGNAPERVHLRGGGQFDVFTPVAAPTTTLENIYYRLHRFAGIGGYGHARVKNGDITAQSGATAATYRVIRECWDKSESTFARLTWQCVGNTSSDDTTANSTCALVEAVPNIANDFAGIDTVHPYAKATTDALAEYCVGGPTTAAGALISTIDSTLKTVYASLIAEGEAGATDSSADVSADASAEADVAAPTVAVPTATASIDASGN